MLGVGSVVRDGIVIGEQSVIGAGAVVVSDLPDNVTAYGVPAKAMTKRDRGVDS
jgi:acetyltransferase-like isoleucine patch superfamily enzyme